MSDEEFLPPRVLGIDPGEKRLGLSISDPFGNFAVGLDTISNYEGKDLLPEFRAVCERYEVKEIIIGLPLHMSGEEGVSAQKARELGAILSEGLGLPVAFMDERLTSKMAEQSLRDMGIKSSRDRHKGKVDQAAAMRILQDYLDRKARRIL